MHVYREGSKGLQCILQICSWSVTIELPLQTVSDWIILWIGGSLQQLFTEVIPTHSNLAKIYLSQGFRNYFWKLWDKENQNENYEGSTALAVGAEEEVELCNKKKSQMYSFLQVENTLFAWLKIWNSRSYRIACSLFGNKIVDLSGVAASDSWFDLWSLISDMLTVLEFETILLKDHSKLFFVTQMNPICSLQR